MKVIPALLANFEAKPSRNDSKNGNVFYVTDGNIMYLTDASRFLISCVIQHYAPVVGWGGGNRCIMLIMTLGLDPGDKH